MRSLYLIKGLVTFLMIVTLLLIIRGSFSALEWVDMSTIAISDTMCAFTVAVFLIMMWSAE